MTERTQPVDLSARRRIHVVAVGGYAMSAIARYFTQLGHEVTGCDVTDSPMLVALADEGVEVSLGHSVDHVVEGQAFISVTSAVGPEHIELVHATQLGIPVLSRGETMQLIVESKPNVAVVSGTHGKTSTTAMLTHILHTAGLHPSFFVGGVINDFGTNARFDSEGEWLVVEGDESDHSFLDYRRDIALITNIEPDHLDRWGDDFESLLAGFAAFADGATRACLLCIDDPNVATLAASRPHTTTYGYGESAMVRAIDYRPTPRGSQIDVVVSGSDPVTVSLKLRGRDMAQNALGALAMSLEMGVPLDAAVRGIEAFCGVKRRFEFRGSHNGVDCFDDYAHTSTEIRTTLARAKEGSWTRVIAVVQPHRYSRVSRHWQDFGNVFGDADIVVVAALDPAFEPPIAGVSSELVVQAIRGSDPNAKVLSYPDWQQLRDIPWSLGRPGDCIVTLGCGSITRIHDDWQSR